MKAAKATGKQVAKSRNGPSMFPAALLVPHLAQACIRALDENDSDAPGSSLKKLRLVSRGVKEVLQRRVSGYTLTLGAEHQAHSLACMAFLRSVRLLSLIVVFPTLPASADAGILTAAAAQHSLHLSSFVAQMGSTLLSGITRLQVTLPIIIGADPCETAAARALTSMLLPLAFACPNLVQLTVTGRVGPSFLQAFGSFCPHLTCLRASLTNLADTTLQQLPALLPHLTSLSALPADSRNCYRQPNDHMAPNAAACIALQACPTLLHFDSASYYMTAEVWAALPRGLLTCTTSCRGWGTVISSPPPLWQQHPGLQSITITSNNEISLQELALLLASAPNLSAMSLRRMTVSIKNTDGLAAELGLLQARLTAGLAVTCKRRGWPWLAELPTHLDLYFTSGGSQQMPLYLTAEIPPCPSFRKVTFHGGGSHCEGDLSQLPRIFPGLEDLTLLNHDLPYSNKYNGMKGDAQLTAMAACKSLRRLEFDEARYVTREGLAGLCAGSSSLREVKLYGCRDVEVKDQKAMAKRGWGGMAIIKAERGAALDDEDKSWGGGRRFSRKPW